MLRKPPDFAVLLRAMISAHADFVIIGGLAMIVHGSEYVTSDVDFAVRRGRENAERVAEALKEFHPRPEGLDPSLPFVWDWTSVNNSTILTLASDAGSVDVLLETPGVTSYKELADRAVEVELYGSRVRVASIQDLIQMKTAAGRPKDQLHLVELKHLLELRQSEARDE